MPPRALRHRQLPRKHCKKRLTRCNSLNAVTISECPFFAAAGLTVKNEPKLNPHLIIHGIPVEFLSEDILKSIAEQNSLDVNSNGVKVVYLYPEKLPRKVVKKPLPPDSGTSETSETSNESETSDTSKTLRNNTAHARLKLRLISESYL